MGALANVAARELEQRENGATHGVWVAEVVAQRVVRTGEMLEEGLLERGRVELGTLA